MMSGKICRKLPDIRRFCRNAMILVFRIQKKQFLDFYGYSLKVSIRKAGKQEKEMNKAGGIHKYKIWGTLLNLVNSFQLSCFI